jgi:hypothetical protein
VRIILKCILNKKSVGLIDLTHDGVQLQAYVNAVVDLQVLRYTDNYFCDKIT